jgi:hypothetical protein
MIESQEVAEMRVPDNTTTTLVITILKTTTEMAIISPILTREKRLSVGVGAEMK